MHSLSAPKFFFVFFDMSQLHGEGWGESRHRHMIFEIIWTQTIRTKTKILPPLSPLLALLLMFTFKDPAKVVNIPREVYVYYYYNNIASLHSKFVHTIEKFREITEANREFTVYFPTEYIFWVIPELLGASAHR